MQSQGWCPRARQGSGGPAMAPATASRAGLAPQTPCRQLRLLGVPIKSSSGHRGPTPSSAETSDLLNDGTPAVFGDPHTAPPHTQGHPDPVALGPMSTPTGGSSSERLDHVTPQLPNRGGSTRHMTQTGRVDSRGGPTLAGLWSCSDQSQQASSAQRLVEGLGGGRADRPAWWDQVGFQAL